MLGIFVAAVGAGLDNSLVVWVAIGLLGTALILRLIAGVRRRRADSQPDSGSAEQDE